MALEADRIVAITIGEHFFMFENLSDLKVFMLIFQCKSLSDAARALKMTPGMVSKRLTQLEGHLGLRLFHRTTRIVQPTEEGKRLYAQATNIFEMIDTYESDWGGLKEPSGLLKVSASASFARIYLMPLIVDFLKKHPKMQIRLDLSDRVVDIVEEGIDVAIRISLMTDSSLVARKLGPGSRLICASPTYLAAHPPIHEPADLLGHNCVVLNDRYVWEFNIDGKPFTQKVDGSFQCNYGEATIQCIRAGLGIGIVSYWHIKDDLEKGNVVAVLKDYPLANDPNIYAVYPSRKFVPMRTKAFVDYLEQNLKIPLIKD